MAEQNDQPEPSTEPLAPDFEKHFRQAQATGDFEYVMNTAKQSDRMIRDFRAAVMNAQFPGRESGPVAMGINFLDKMIQQSAGQMNALKRAERESKDAVKAALNSHKNGGPMSIIDPEQPTQPPENPAPEPPAPDATPEAPSA